ncbi:glycosyltransferase family 2 protein [Halomonas sp. GDM18]|nr:glycosyltransferase family 2 protein [Halomonas sp. GDM18]
MISVIVPLYNKSKYLSRCVSFLNRQVSKNFEVIFIDDASTDDTFDVFVNLDKNFDFSFVKNLKNSGVSYSRNKGVSLSKYDYIAFLDPDDIWLKKHIECFVRVINSNDVNIIGANFVYLEDGIRKYNTRLKGNYIEKNYFEKLVKGIVILNSSNICLKKSTFLKEGGFPVGYPQGEDIYLWAKLALNNPIYFIATPSVIYDRNASEESKKPPLKPYPIIDNKEYFLEKSKNKENFNDIVTYLNMVDHNFFKKIKINKIKITGYKPNYRFKLISKIVFHVITLFPIEVINYLYEKRK